MFDVIATKAIYNARKLSEVLHSEVDGVVGVSTHGDKITVHLDAKPADASAINTLIDAHGALHLTEQGGVVTCANPVLTGQSQLDYEVWQDGALLIGDVAEVQDGACALELSAPAGTYTVRFQTKAYPYYSGELEVEIG